MIKMIVSFAVAAAAAAAVSAPALCFAQSNPPVTRADVRADLVRVEQAGYNPNSGSDIHYPADIQAAEAKIAAQDDQPLTTQAVGGVAQNGNTASGTSNRSSTHHGCVGPISFCNIYFGS